jgi:hypothetical protein
MKSSARIVDNAVTTILTYGMAPYIVGRLILADAVAAKAYPTSQSLRTAIDALRHRRLTLEYLATPAGYHEDSLPSGWSGRSGWPTPAAEFNSLRPEVEGIAKRLVHEAGALNGPVRYISLGIDLRAPASRVHIETAVLYDTWRDSVVAFTGKSFPTLGQERKLIRNPMLANHLASLDTQRAVTLVCHDLSMFNPRGRAVRKGMRDKVGDALARIIGDQKPSIALHQAHTVESPGTWRNAWAVFRAENPSVRGYTTAFRFLGNRGGKPHMALSHRVLEATRGGDVGAIDIILASEASARLLTER